MAKRPKEAPAELLFPKGAKPAAKRVAARPAAAIPIDTTPIDPFALQTIYCGDNLEKLSRMPSKSVDLIYIDPPFNSNRNYEVFWGETKEPRAFEDRHESTRAYIEFMQPRCEQLHRILKDSGSFYYHCDWHASHYVKVMLDHIFGENLFQAEIIWERTNSRSEPSRWPRVHDTIFHYSKTSKYFFNRLMVPGDIAKVPHTLIKGPDGLKYNTYELTGPGRRDGESGRPWRNFDPDKFGRHWGYNHAQLDEWDAAGLIHWPKKAGKSGGFPRKRAETPFVAENRMVQLGDVWTDIDRINQSAHEKTGYPTQKPLPLLERIIEASSDEADIVLDAFCSCGTALEAAQNLGRRWIGIDISPTACRVMSNRLTKRCGLSEGEDFYLRDLPKTAEQLREYPHFEFENWAVNALNTVLVNGRAIPNKVKVNDKGIDGRIYPIRADKTRIEGWDLFGPTDDWLPIQVKQKDVVNRDEIDTFYGAMKRQNRNKGFFISFDFSAGAIKEMRRLHDDPVNGLEIIPLTVDEILAEEVRYRV